MSALSIDAISATSAYDEVLNSGTVLIDIREPTELVGKIAYGAINVPMNSLESRLPNLIKSPDQRLLLICETGKRSDTSTRSLRANGYSNVLSVHGGFRAWVQHDLPVQMVPHDPEATRYVRQIMLPEVGSIGQRALQNAKVLIVGAGGLGSPAAIYLTLAGVGTLGIADNDSVEESNLHRQPLHTEGSVSRQKVASASDTVRKLRSSLNVNVYPTRVDSSNASSIVSGYEVVLDCCDNFAARYALNSAAVAAGVPLVHAAIFRFEGHVSVFWPALGDNRSSCYVCSYPEQPEPEFSSSCNEAGVIGVLPGMLGILQAWEAIKVLLKIDSPLLDETGVWNGLDMSFSKFERFRDPQCPVCASRQLRSCEMPSMVSTPDPDSEHSRSEFSS
ncbi:ThiF family adenylyltransferase [Bradyrhizobium sp. CB1015]|uniref:ThiF family adenylyltransferase n=1 Tax=Bradyrhizobium sp. CB1015 TaxID=2976822 RepID=UPI0021A9AAB0|nr:ThiF family adenylyltransferase [Bradyrhizobium sp. CB1015]UWU92067.1 ThiF family adenylyltransferase [Bradyrhizobium sp. CB1015]